MTEQPVTPSGPNEETSISKESPSTTYVISEKEKKILKEIEKITNKYENEETIRLFFSHPNFERFWYVSFEEYREIFGNPIDEEAIGKIQKFWAEKNITYFNTSYDLLWYVKWVPVGIKFATNLFR